jgi:hypothetical protein
MTHDDERLTPDHVMAHILAFFVAGVVPAPFLVSPFVFLVPLVLPFTLGHAFLLALPLYLILRSYAPRRINLISSAAAGFAIGAVSGTYFAWPWVNKPPSVIVGGALTYDGWLLLGQLVGTLGMLGALGGFAFWFVLLMCAALPGDAIERQSRANDRRST